MTNWTDVGDTNTDDSGILSLVWIMYPLLVVAWAVLAIYLVVQR